VKSKILVFADWYLPGYKAGGLITALSNLADSIGDTFDLYVFTRDRDLTDENPYSGIRPNRWVSVDKARVLYTSDLSFRHLRRRICEVKPDVIYLNSFFSPLTIKTLFLRKLGLLPKSPVVLAPRGECSPGALKVKSLKKNIYRNSAVRAGLYQGLIWQASSELEAEQIATVVYSARRKQPCIRVAPDLPSRDWSHAAAKPPKKPKDPGGRFLSISRIAPVKNILFALEAIEKLKGNVEYDIFGPIDDREYWDDCQKRMKSLPDNVVVRYRGMIPRELVPKVALDYDFFLLATQGESFGYVILEAMAAGCPVILSDRTPWRDLAERGAGWTLPLEDCDLWRHTLQQCVDMEPGAYATLSSRAREFVQAWAASARQRDETIQLFNLALHGESLASCPDSLQASSPSGE
jgi:glycosyltransferase involved in cell wall biosynthesis